MRILDRYIGRIILQYTMIVLLILLGLFTFVNFLDQLGSMGQGDYDIWQVMRFVALSTPRVIYEIFPMCAMLGTTIGLSMLANDSELIVMRASGISMLRITASALRIGALFVIISIIFGEVISPYTETAAQRGKAQALEQDIKQGTNFGLWLRDNDTYVNIDQVLPDLTLLNLKVFEFDQNNQLRSLVTAEEGSFEETEGNQNYWQLKNIKQTQINLEGTPEVTAQPEAKWVSGVSPQILSVFLTGPEQLSFLQLRRYIRHLKANAQNTDSYELTYWSKLMLPLSTAIMVILAIPFVFSNIRSGNLGRNIFIGIMIGLGFYVFNKSFGFVVLAYGISPMVGSVVPVLLFLLVALIMIQRVE